jgi:hypothetical protein
MHTRFHPPLFILLLFASLPLCAQEADSSLLVPQTLEQAEAQRQRADAMRKEAKQRHTEEEAACYQKILVNSCLDEAKERYSNTIIEARQLDTPAREFQRASRRSEVTAEKNQRADERSAHEAEQQEQAGRYRAEEASKAAEREQKRQDKERKAEENRKKSAKKQAKRQLREEKRAKKQAEQIEKKAREHAKEEKKKADKADQGK